MEDVKRELVFVPAPALGHMASTIELTNRLLSTTHPHHRISITILIVNFPYTDNNFNSYFQSLPSIFPNIRFIILPPVDPPPLPAHVAIETLVSLYGPKWTPQLKNALTQLTESAPTRLTGLVIDFLFTDFIDVATQLGVPTFLNYTTNAAMLGLILHLPTLDANYPKTTEFTELAIPSFANSVPPTVLPTPLLKKSDDSYKWYVHHCGRLRELKGILVNTFPDLERHAIESFSGAPKVYAVGPIVDVEGKGQLRPVGRGEQERIMRWLDRQPEESVVLVCFGSMAGLSGVELREIAAGVEASGYRFLWSLRKAPRFSGDGKVVEEDPMEGLPEGFEGRVEGGGGDGVWVGGAGGGVGAQGNWGVCESLRVELDIGEFVVWGANSNLAYVRGAAVECVLFG
ncbi:hypothetical protein Sjap_003648 [Stephania japonica]|uniref:Uncharacterized protein n=1 Tax=Stephania japonica TaxID=461633 RepID=A0AAP0KQR5_9MAGN